MASLSINNTSKMRQKAILLAILGSAGVLTACGGGGGGTTRIPTDDGGTTTPEVTYKLTVTSPVTLKNASVTVVDAATNKQVAQGTIADSGEISFDIKAADTNKILVAQISAKDSSSTYYDPSLNKQAPLNITLHRAFPMLIGGAVSIPVSPFTEIAYQRSLVRGGSLNKNNPDNSVLDVLNLEFAAREVLATFGVNSFDILPTIKSRSDYTKFVFIPQTGNTSPLNTTAQYRGIFFSIGHYMIQHNENPTDTTPYLTFAKRAAEDLRDGSLDGMTLMGDGTNGASNSIYLKNPMVTPQILNTNPAFNKTKIILVPETPSTEPTTPEEINTIKEVQLATRQNYADRLKANLLGFMTSIDLNKADEVDGVNQGLKSFQTFNFVDGISLENSNNVSAFRLHSFGAGNYKRAFGIEPILINKGGYKPIRDNNCISTNVDAPVDAEKTVTPNCTIGLNADDESSDPGKSDIEGIVGTYSSADGCKLTITFNGLVTLSKGSLNFNTTVNRDDQDALIRTSSDASNQSYILNVGAPERTPAEFIQMNIVDRKIINATAGTNQADKDNKFPKVLSEQKLICTF